METTNMKPAFTEPSIFFWGGIYSQWYKSPFIIDGVKFNTAEQYMMYKKALMFGDYQIAEQIMKKSNPADQKALGRKVRNFDSAHWNKYCRQIVEDANYAKFTQNPHLYAELMDSVGAEIVEASPHDKIWGIGLAANDPRVHDREQWQGTNWLGEAIMAVRDRLEHNRNL